MCLATALQLSLRPLEIFLLLPLVLLMSLLPVSIAGWGVRETAMVGALSFVAVAETDALLLSVLFGLIVMVIGLPGGFLWLLRPSKVEAEEESSLSEFE